MLAHRAEYERRFGSIPNGMEIDHLCRVKSCVNPAHLEAVTPVENKRRSSSTRLTADNVAAIRQASGEPYRVLAERYGVTKAYIGDIRNGRAWIRDYL